MATRTRRSDALSRERIVDAAVEVLDASGESGLTFRVLTERLATGAGAIYWHVANRDELLGAATDGVVAAALADRPSAGSPEEELRAVGLRLFDAIDDHPWLGTQLGVQMSRSPTGPTTPRLVEAFGRPIRDLGVPEPAWFTATTTVLSYVLGAAGQNAVNGRAGGGGLGRAEFLDATAAAWEALDEDGYPFVRRVARQMRGHDDQEQFLAGLDLVVGGIRAAHPPER
ncbi:TetR/AcrR family transcriptional regulator [Actinomycetospora termitidis]|uniref:TetR/AcrR family transcriptional regulator C-terminal domain-containing protein n=1 Tax=Actinomycetospora termitidis TaxID=3053470 RepID=A0ABT7MFW7_9PSEU|nr:TetR/AcrR family transcriptional regulator [Actinomycetospora sp. Odt1-22]MDL5158862.1 TetR/AcrR family transcriptional regulator C-terminal domain-containing protein [Actinomycetospora sp. Odt1-22]